jgi:hypothetical protein
MKHKRQKPAKQERIIKRNLAKKLRFHQKKKQFNKKRVDQIRRHVGKPFPESGNEKSKTKTVENKSSADLKKNWWIHLWSGLVIDETAKHQKAMRSAIWLYLYLLLVANRRNGMLFRKISTMEKETGFNRRTIARWLKTLRDDGYIETHSTGRFLQIVIKKWRPIIGTP